MVWTHTRDTDSAFELEGHRHQQVPQHETTAGTQLYFNLINKFNNMCMMTRAKKEAGIKDIKNVLEELWGFPQEETPCKIFAREVRLGVDEVFVLSQEDLNELSCKTDDSCAVHLASVDVGRIRILLHYKSHLLEKVLHPDDVSFRFTSITRNDYDMFATHPERK